MTENQQEKTKILTINELLKLRSQISFYDRSYVSSPIWSIPQRAEYILKLILRKLTYKQAIKLYVRDFDKFAPENPLSLFVANHYIPADPGYEELISIYNYLGYYQNPDAEFALNNARDMPGCSTLLKVLRLLVKIYCRQEYDANIHNPTYKPLRQVLIYRYSNYPQNFKDFILKSETKVIFSPLPQNRKDKNKVQLGGC